MGMGIRDEFDLNDYRSSYLTFSGQELFLGRTNLYVVHVEPSRASDSVLKVRKPQEVIGTQTASGQSRRFTSSRCVRHQHHVRQKST